MMIHCVNSSTDRAYYLAKIDADGVAEPAAKSRTGQAHGRLLAQRGGNVFTASDLGR